MSFVSVNRHRKRVFDATKKVYARDPIRTQGLVFDKGEEIEWRELGIDQRSVEMWYRLKMISHNPEGDTAR